MGRSTQKLVLGPKFQNCFQIFMYIGEKSANLQKGRKMNHGPMHAHLSEKNQAKKGKKA